MGNCVQLRAKTDVKKCHFHLHTEKHLHPQASSQLGAAWPVTSSWSFNANLNIEQIFFLSWYFSRRKRWEMQ